MRLFTIGHSVHNLDKFVQLFNKHDVTTLVDIRTTPASRYQPQFNQAHLEQFLPPRSIRYIFAGKYLGGRPSDPVCYKGRMLLAEGANYLHEVDYLEIMRQAWFVKGIQRLLELANEQTTAIMCSEEDPSLCHRHHLIAKYLMRGHPEVDVQHIRGSGIVFSATSLLTSVNEPLAYQAPLF